MHINTSHFPRVWMSSVGIPNWESKLDSLLQQKERFVLLTREMPGRGQNFDKEDRKRFARWLKCNREQLKLMCAGSIVVVTNPVVALSLRATLVPFAKAFGYPVRAVTESSVDDEVHDLLSGV